MLEILEKPLTEEEEIRLSQGAFPPEPDQFAITAKSFETPVSSSDDDDDDDNPELPAHQNPFVKIIVVLSTMGVLGGLALLVLFGISAIKTQDKKPEPEPTPNPENGSKDSGSDAEAKLAFADQQRRSAEQPKKTPAKPKKEQKPEPKTLVVTQPTPQPVSPPLQEPTRSPQIQVNSVPVDPVQEWQKLAQLGRIGNFSKDAPQIQQRLPTESAITQNPNGIGLPVKIASVGNSIPLDRQTLSLVPQKNQELSMSSSITPPSRTNAPQPQSALTAENQSPQAATELRTVALGTPPSVSGMSPGEIGILSGKPVDLPTSSIISRSQNTLLPNSEQATTQQLIASPPASSAQATPPSIAQASTLPKEAVVGSLTKAKVLTPLQIGSQTSRGTVELTEPILATDGTISIPAGTRLIVQTGGEENGFSISAIAVVRNQDGKTEQLPIEPKTLIVRDKDGNEFQSAKPQTKRRALIRTEDLAVGILGGLSQAGQLLNQPTVQSSGIPGVTQTTISQTQNPNLGAAIAQGVFQNAATQANQALQERRDLRDAPQLESRTIPKGQEVTVSVENFLTVN